MDYQKGDRVKHPLKDDWGIGEVIDYVAGNSVKVFFVGASEKNLLLKYVKPTKLQGEEANHPILDNLKTSSSKKAIKYQSLPQSIAYFLEEYPGGFHGAKFENEEREYKDKAAGIAKELLSERSFEKLLQEKNYQELTKRILKVANATNLIFPNEKMALKDGLIDELNQKRFMDTLFALLYGGKVPFNERFNQFAKVLEDINSAKWTTVTYFPFIIYPSQNMFIKPTITQHVAELCGFELNYKPQLNWITYKSVLDFSNYLFTALTELKPRDMIDVQSFMWCVAPKV